MGKNEEGEVNMNIIKAVQLAYFEHKKIRCSGWPKNKYIKFLQTDELILVTNELLNYDIDYQELLNDDNWEVYEEEKEEEKEEKEKAKTVTFQEAFKAFKEGKIITRGSPRTNYWR